MVWPKDVKNHWIFESKQCTLTACEKFLICNHLGCSKRYSLNTKPKLIVEHLETHGIDKNVCMAELKAEKNRNKVENTNWAKWGFASKSGQITPLHKHTSFVNLIEDQKMKQTYISIVAPISS